MKKKSQSRDEKSRVVCFILYPDNLAHMDCLEKLKGGLYKANWIKHDKGLVNDPDASKEHYHVVMGFNSARWHEPLADELGIEYNLIQHCRNKLAYMYYCLHWDYPDKHQYQVKDFCGDKANIGELMETIEKKTPKKIRFKMLCDYINEQDLLLWSDFVKFCLDRDKYDLLMKHTYLFKTLVDEHNNEIKWSRSLTGSMPDEWKK